MTRWKAARDESRVSRRVFIQSDNVLLLVDNTGPDDYMFNDPRTVRWASLLGSFGQSIMAPLGNRLDPGPPEES